MAKPSRADIHARLSYSELALRILFGIFCVAIIVDTVVILSAIDDVELYMKEFDRVYENKDGYRKGAIWSLVVAAVGFIYHPLIVIVRFFLLSQYCLKSSYNVYSYSKAVFCGVFALFFFSGGIVNAVFANDNAQNVDDFQPVCLNYTQFSEYQNYGHNFCSHLKKVRDSETAAAVLSFLAVNILAVLVVVTAYTGTVQMPEDHYQSLTSSTTSATQQKTSLSSYA